MPLLIRAHNLLKNLETRGKEIRTIFTNGLNKKYPLRVLKRWNEEAKRIVMRPENEVKEMIQYRNGQRNTEVVKTQRCTSSNEEE